MRRHHTLLLALAIFIPAVCHGQTKCPWINEATARGILGGAVNVSVTTNVSHPGDGVCKFSRQQGTAVYELRISVGIMTDIPKQFPTYLAQCPPKSTPLRAIGNEAVMCSSDAKPDAKPGANPVTKDDPFAEKVVGRVRNQAFVVSVSSTLQNGPAMTLEMRRDKANLIAEQVAGILF
jgi:hypothetical protein